MKVAIVAATFYPELAARLVAGATGRLEEADAEVGQVLSVPGAFELPAVASLAARSGSYDAVVALGAVIRGETDHYDFVCGECARGLMDVTLSTGVPCGFGLLTVDTYEQALERAGGGKRDSGAHAAEAVLAVLAAVERLSAPVA